MTKITWMFALSGGLFGIILGICGIYSPAWEFWALLVYYVVASNYFYHTGLKS